MWGLAWGRMWDGLPSGRPRPGGGGWLLQGHTARCGGGLACSKTSVPPPSSRGTTRVPLGAARPFPVRPLLCLARCKPPSESGCPVAGTSPAGPHGLVSVGPSWGQAGDCDSFPGLFPPPPLLLGLRGWICHCLWGFENRSHEEVPGPPWVARNYPTLWVSPPAEPAAEPSSAPGGGLRTHSQAEVPPKDSF